jgi:hypothetical protein
VDENESVILMIFIITNYFVLTGTSVERSAVLHHIPETPAINLDPEIICLD